MDCSIVSRSCLSHGQTCSGTMGNSIPLNLAQRSCHWSGYNPGIANPQAYNSWSTTSNGGNADHSSSNKDNAETVHFVVVVAVSTVDAPIKQGATMMSNPLPWPRGARAVSKRLSMCGWHPVVRLHHQSLIPPKLQLASGSSI